jgi:hypothetical protein
VVRSRRNECLVGYSPALLDSAAASSARLELGPKAALT